jgi:hypothetical protein
MVMQALVLKKTMWISCLAVGVVVFSCGDGDDDDKKRTPAATEISFPAGVDHPDEDRPAETATGGEPVITDLSYSKVARQGGDLTGLITFTDPDDYTKVTTLLFKLDQDDGFFEFAVTPVLDPLHPTNPPYIAFSIQLAENFTPGIFTFWIGLRDTDGNVSNYLHKVLIVRALKDLGITSMTPLDGATAVPLNTTIRVTFSQQVFSHEAALTLLEGSTQITGTGYMSGNGLVMTFIPDTFLAPDAVHHATITLLVNNQSLTTSFTAEAASPLPSPADLVGKTFSVTMDKDNLIEPEEGKAIFDTIPILPTILMKMLSLNGDTITSLSGAASGGAGGFVQMSAVPTFGPSPSRFVDPYFWSGPTEMIIDLSALGLPGKIGVYGINVSGKFAESGGVVTGFDHGSFTAYIDSAEANAIVSEIVMGEIDVCEILPLCDKDGLIRVRAENVTGFHEPGIDYLYDMTCAADSDTVYAVTGDNLVVTCTTLEDALPYQGGDITFLAKTGVASGSTQVGAWDTTGYTCTGDPPSCQVPDLSGQISLTLTLDPDELSPGDTSFRVGGTTASPIGNMSRTYPVSVE